MTEEELWEELPETQGGERANVLLALCKQSYERKSGNTALGIAEAALTLYRDIGQSESDWGYISALQARANSLQLLHRVEEALADLEIVAAYLRLSEFRFLDDILRTQSQWYGEIGEWEAALRCQIEAVAINEVDGNQEWLGISRFRSGYCLMKLKKFDDARAELHLARSIFKELAKVNEVGECDEALAKCYFELRAFEAAIDAARRALAIAEVSQRCHQQARTMIVMIKAHVAMGNSEKADPLVLGVEYLATLGSETDWNLSAEVQEVLALYHQARGFPDRAMEHEGRAATIREILG